MAQGGRDRRQRHASGDGRDAETMPQAFGDAWGPSTPASAMVLAIFRWAVARDQGQRGLPAAFAGVERSAWTSSRARSSSGGTGTSRQGSARRFRVRIRIEAASMSMSMGRTARASEIRAPVWAKVWSAGFEEALALIGGQVLPAAGVDELEVADQARHFA